MAEKVEILVEMKDDAAKKEMQQWKTWLDELNKGATVNVRVNSSGITTLEHALSNIGNTFSTIGGALEGIGGLFSIDLLGTVERTLTAYGTILATQGFKSAITRYDIMTTYADYMQIMGVSAEKADESLEKVNQAIQGIPVGLDTAAQEIRMFTMYLQGTGDTMDDVADKATNLTIGLERALVAGGASEAMKTTAKYEVNRLLATGSLSTKRQWQALLNGLGVSGQYLKDVMGYGGMSTQDFITKLTGSKDNPAEISTEQFLEGLAALADYEGLNKAIDIYKTTIEAGMYDIKFAVTRGFANTFMAINETLEKETGKGIRDYMQDLRQGINEAFADVQNWVREHPEVLTMILDKFNDVMERARELNIGQLMADVATQGGKVVDFFIRLYDAFPTDFWHDLFVFSVTWATPLGRLFNLVGAIIGTVSKLSGIAGRLPLIGGLFRALFSFGGAGGTVITGGSIKNTFAGLGVMAGFGGLVAEAGGIIYEFAKIGEKLASINIEGYDDNLSKLMPLIKDVCLIVGGWVGTVGVGQFISGGALATFAFIGEAVAAGLLAEIDYAAIIIGKFADVAQKIADLSLPTNFDKKVGVFADGIQSIFKALPELTDADVTGSRNYNQFYTNMAGAIEGMSKAADALIAAEASFNSITGKTVDLTSKASELAESIGGIYKVLNDEFGLGYAAKWGSNNYPTIVQNMTDAVNKLSEVAVAMQGMQDTLASLSLGLSGESSTLITEETHAAGPATGVKTQKWSKDAYQHLVKRIQELAQGVVDIMNVFGKGVIASLFEDFSSSNQYTTLQNIQLALSAIYGIAVQMQEMQSELSSITAPQMYMLGESQMSGITRTIQTFADELYDLFSSESMRELGGLGAGQTWSENIQALATALGPEGIGSIIYSINSMRPMLEDNISSGAVSLFKIFMDDIYTALGVSDGEGMASRAEQIQTVISVVNDMFTQLAETDLSKLDEVLQAIIDKLANQAVPFMQEFRDAEKEAADEAKKLSSWISVVNTEMVYSKDRISSMIGDLSALVVALDQASNAAQNMSGAINAIPRSINVSYNATRVIKPSNAFEFASGGLAPNGIDSIRAWLSPGEFVMRSRAVNAFGKDFMSRVNALDIKGAMNALVRQYSFPNGAHVSNISNRDNHAVVNQYITTNNPNYSYARASKYVRAL